MVRAKFVVESITEFSAGKKVKLLAVTCGSKENESFFKWTPAGVIEMQTLNDEASKQFTVGKQYYVDFTPAEEDVISNNVSCDMPCCEKSGQA